MRALVACLTLMCVLVPVAEGRMTRAERAVKQKINALRARHGVVRLFGDNRLARAADAHSRDMLRQDFFAHTSSNGTDPSTRIRRYRNARLVGETLAYVPKGGRTSARYIVRLWRNSPSHLHTLTTGRFRRIGVSRLRGRLDGRKVTIWTVDLSSRR